MKYNVIKMTDAEFATIWNKCDSQIEFAVKTGYKQDTAAHRATRLRRSGYQLKSLRTDIPYDGIKQFIHDLNNGVADLTPREVVMLYFSGVNLSFIAEISGRTINAIKCAVKTYRSNGTNLNRRNKQKYADLPFGRKIGRLVSRNERANY